MRVLGIKEEDWGNGIVGLVFLIIYISVIIALWKYILS